jgi:hypothetical protein
LTRAWGFNPTLTIFVIASALLTVAGVVGLLVDPRLVLGMPNWAKATKFGISLTLYGVSLLWMLPMITSRPRLAQLVAHASGALLLVEIAVLVLQTLRGVPSHFNVATPLDAALWTVMGRAIMLLWLVTALGALLLLVQRIPDRVLAWGVRLGLLLTLVGFAEGFLMPSPNAAQRAQLAAGERPGLIGAHTVGAVDGGPGLPLLGWSVEHGDLRVGHFVGIHGVQALPLLAALVRRRRGLRDGHRLALVATGAAGYLGLVALVTWQALRDQPLLQADGLTLAAAGALFGFSAAATACVVAHAQWAGREGLSS